MGGAARKSAREKEQRREGQPGDMEGELLRVSSGTRLVTENELSRKMFIIKSGKVRVSKHYMGQKVTLAILGEGEVFGELSFFDAAPRSASVDALTDLEVIVIDGKKAVDQIAGLPSWVVPIFKTVFHRFREADQKIAVLQSMNEFQKKVLRTDGVAKSVYLELLRFIRTLELLYSRSQKMGAVVSRDDIYRELDEVLGKRVIGLSVFWRTLKEHDFMNAALEENKNQVHLNNDSLTNLKQYLAQEIESERFLFLSYSAVAVLRKVVGTIFDSSSGGPDAARSEEPVTISMNVIKVHNLPLYKEGLDELAKYGLIEYNDLSLSFVPPKVMEVFNFQSILKSFDHTIVQMGDG